MELLLLLLLLPHPIATVRSVLHRDTVFLRMGISESPPPQIPLATSDAFR